LQGASIPGASLNKVLVCLRDGRPVSNYQLFFLQKQGLEALHRFASGALTYDRFRELALVEQATRIKSATAAKLVDEAEKRADKAGLDARTEAARLARESDPKNIAKTRNKELRTRYGINIFVEEHCLRRLMRILRHVDVGRRLKQEDFVWLSSVGEDYFSDKLASAYHRMEADFFATEFKKTHDPWMAVEASSHYRKCKGARDAVSLLETIDVERQTSSKVKSALCTTHGGALRDLGLRDEAIRLGEKAHALDAADYRPCTLLGAVHMEDRNLALGHEWYEKAIKRGAKKDSVDQDIRKIFFRADQAKKEEMRAFLLRENPNRFSWARKTSD
jgi:hypothetical protein